MYRKNNRFLESRYYVNSCYRKTNQYNLAEIEYAIVCQDKRLKDNRQNYIISQVLQTNQKYDETAKWYQNYLQSFPNDSWHKINKACENINKYILKNNIYITNHFNTDGYDFWSFNIWEYVIFILLPAEKEKISNLKILIHGLENVL